MMHGLTGLPEYRAWASMRYRCHNPRCEIYLDYGGRGIRICDRWSSFEAFLEDMGPRPSSKHSIDRIDNNGHYTPENCRWATYQQQNSNTRKTRWITHNGETRTLTDWARSAGIDKGTFHGRLLNGWSMERALAEPVSEERTERARKGKACPPAPERQCETCGMAFRPTPAQVRDGCGRFCSGPCYWSSMKGIPPSYLRK